MIRQATPEDCAACAAISRMTELAKVDGASYPEETFQEFFAPGDIFLVDEEGGVVRGFIAGEPMHGDAHYLSLLAVAEQGKGVGKALLAAYEEEVKRMGLSMIVLHALAINTRAKEFYRRRGYYGAPDETPFYKRLC
ncbi:GNAT family N-acetyltransferase [Candidatus Woesearchaeota archaeon]|nr:MAG: GNAT family N-acetyltransferase [Candidatus Woesearchaeota archaeon]